MASQCYIIVMARFSIKLKDKVTCLFGNTNLQLWNNGARNTVKLLNLLALSNLLHCSNIASAFWVSSNQIL